MDKALKFKTFSFEMKDVDEAANEGRFVGYASTFGNIDLGLDVVEKGAFKRTLKDSKGRVPILADHDPYKQIGWNEKASEDDSGLLVEGAINLDVQMGRERYALAKQAMKLKAKMGLSIGYLTIKGEPDKDNPRVRRLKEVRLFEYSFVTFPMNMDAMVTAAKGLGGVDKANFFLQQLKDQGISTHDLEMALQLNAELATPLEDPAIGQSINRILNVLKS